MKRKELIQFDSSRLRAGFVRGRRVGAHHLLLQLALRVGKFWGLLCDPRCFGFIMGFMRGAVRIIHIHTPGKDPCISTN